MAKVKTKTPRDTQSRQRFLASAEYMFAEYGYEGAKIRAIADHSGVNLGALHHYWGSKEELFRAVCLCRLQPMNDERLRRFKQLEDNVEKHQDIDIRELFHASLEPTFFLNDLSSEEHIVFQKFYGRALTEPSPVVSAVMKDLFAPMSNQFFCLLRTLCPQLTDDEFYWRANCIFGTYVYVPAFSERMEFYAHEDFDSRDYKQGIVQIIEFLVAGMQAPSLQNKDTNPA